MVTKVRGSVVLPGSAVTEDQEEILSHWSYDDSSRRLVSDKAIETTLNSLYLGEQHKMSSGSENIYFTNLSSDINFFPMWGGLKDQSITANRDSTGFIPPSGRVYSDMFSLPLGGAPSPLTSVGYDGDNYFGINISGLGITTVAAETVAANVRLEYRIVINGRQVYMQELPRNALRSSAGAVIYPNDTIEWFFDHPVDVRAGTTLTATIVKVDNDTDLDLGVFQVRQGDTVDPNTGLLRYQATVHNRLFEDKDLELISPYLKYKAMDFSVDATGGSILLKDLTKATGEQLLIPHNINTLQAVADGTEIQIKVKGGAKIIIESLPVNAVSINGNFVSSILNNAVTELNNLFTNTLSFASQGNPVLNVLLSENYLTVILTDLTSFTVDITTLGVDTNNFVDSGVLNGTDLVLTMDDATTVVIDASGLAVDTNDVVESGTLNGDDLELTLSNASVITIDVSALAVDTTLYVESGVLSGTDLVLTMSDASTVTIDASSLAIDSDTTITGGEVSGTDILLDVSDGSTLTIDASTLGGSGSSGNPVVSGSVVGTDLILVLDDATEITIDASNMINGSTTFASGADWYISYGTYANESVNSTTSHIDSNRTPPVVGGKAPFYFGTALTRGTEFRWNNNPNASHLLGIWDGTEAQAGTYNSRVPSNWSTAFNYHVTGFQASSNVSLTNTTATNRYTPSFGAPLALRFLSDGHITLSDLSGATEVEISKTNNPLVVTEFQLQLGCDANFVFPQFVVQDTENIWEIVHDYNGTESGILNGILDHTVIKSAISIEIGEKIMFMLDEVGQGDYFGTNYTAAGTGVATAEEQLDNTFIYQTNEAIVMSTANGVSDWTPNTSAAGYFFAASLHQYRVGGAGTIQGMFSLRFNSDGKLTIYDEDAGVKIATAAMDPAPGSSVHFYFGVKGNRAYYSIPVISKQSLGAGSQPVLTFAPDVSDQSFSVAEGEAFSVQIALDGNSDIVNMYGEVDAPTWAVLNQETGVFIGTAPAFTGSSDSYVINCKAANAIGGITNFTVTMNVTEVAYTNAKSLSFDGSSTFVQGNATVMNAMDRATNGDGNAWSLSMWVKPGNNTATQTLFVYGAGDDYNGAAITIKKVNTNGLAIVYGSVYENIITLASVLNHSQWSHLLITFDGGTTGNNSADVADYYSRFKVYLNGFAASTIGVNSGQGYTGAISGANVSDNIFRIGRASNVHNNYLDAIINQVGIWNTDQSANAAAIYNSGVAQDLSDLTVPPTHYYEVESSVTAVPDLIGNVDLIGYNFTSSDLVTDTP